VKKKASMPGMKKRGLSIRKMSPASEKIKPVPNHDMPPRQPLITNDHNRRKKIVAGCEIVPKN